MKRFLYVEARDVSVPDVDDAPVLSLASVIVVTEDEDMAYRLGPAHLAVQFERTGDARDHYKGRLLNDYVTEIPTA